MNHSMPAYGDVLELHFKTAAVKCAVAMSVLTWNAGRQGLVHVFKKFSCPSKKFRGNTPMP